MAKSEERIKISHETCRRFGAGELSPKELREMWEDEPEEFEEWYREICKEWYSEGIFKNRRTPGQIDELITGFNTNSLTDRQLEIFKVYYPDTYIAVSGPTPEIYHYMVFRAAKEKQEITLDEKWFKAYIGKGARYFFGVEVDDSGSILSDVKNPVWFAEFKSQ